MGGDPPAPETNESMASVLKALEESYPGLVEVMNQSATPIEQARLDAARVTLPGWQELNAQMSPMAREQAKQDALAQVATDEAALAAANTQGGLLDTALESYRKVDPEYYKTREALSNRVGDLLNSININGLSGSETAELERSLNRDNNATPSALSTASRAMTFGSALAGKRAELANALNVATGALPAMKSGMEPFQQATGRSGSVSTASSQFATPSSENVGNAAANTFSNVLGSATSFRNTQLQRDADRRDTLDRFGQTITALNSVCCMTLICNLDINAELFGVAASVPFFVRNGRDALADFEVRLGYKAFSKFICPLMIRYKFVRDLVKALLYDPLTAHAGSLYQIPGLTYGSVYKPFHNFWFSVWKIIGKFIKKG